ncbi:phenylalanine--tRNA ligase subunit beta [Denitrificimonas sp. JX-1]|uniref:Phenylalanine--tRNA ligase beta subunit n=1 Tax=Denitrificimonas halotolerans TaxID=3098930 RepID=A0ABU5GQF7_9GAMM|nr:phenylalanine--tRNA ligase subunit beta [Denitrificimonas sp. JX-1]MDY7219089.1 phenylalanine--tRNA ligase subunit beta [Denitrificimonas sp. JX-1]
MNFSEQWLRSLVDPKVSRDELIARLSMAGLEVDGVAPVAGEFSGVVVGEILNAEQHPDADKLRVCTVNDGEQNVQVVCGAPNARPGIKVPFARVGAILPGNFKIKKAKLRGVESFGMLCAANELQISDDDAGLLELSADAVVGQCLREALNLDDVSVEVDLTPNRGDCLSLQGLAREVGALYNAPVQLPSITPVAAQHDEKVAVELLSSEACPRYVGRVIKGVDLNRTTPTWMVQRLERSDIRSIDPVVDVTNYVMLELGQPLHAFDLAQIKGRICVRMAHENEKITLLDGQEVCLKTDTLVIADQQRALAIAGVMGGEDSGVTVGKTTDIFLESAFFEPIAIAGKARSYGLHTDASHRFERGVDWQLPAQAIERATELLLSIVGGSAGPVQVSEDVKHLPQVEPIRLRAERVKQMFGLSLADEQIEALLRPLGLKLDKQGEGVWLVTAPSHRFDISIEVDLLEEIGRLYGYDQLPVRYPAARLAPQSQPEAQAQLPVLRRLLVARGYQEAITYSFIEPEIFATFHPELEPLKLANPISAELSVMRASLLPGLLKALQHNLNRQQGRIRLFESGLRFVGQLENLKQERMLAGVITGLRLPEVWTHGKESVDFYDIKGDVEALLGAVGDSHSYSFVPCQQYAFHPGQCARIERNGEPVGYVGTLHPKLATELDINQQTLMFEVQLDAISEGRLPTFTELSRFPEVRRDLALVVNAEVPAQQLMDDMRAAAGEFLTQIRLFDVYQGKGVAEGCKSLAVGLTWQHPSRTLTDEEVGAATEAILTSLSDKFGAILRK